MHAFSIEATREDQSAKIILKAASKALKDRFNGVDVPPVNSAEIGKCDFF